MKKIILIGLSLTLSTLLSACVSESNNHSTAPNSHVSSGSYNEAPTTTITTGNNSQTTSSNTSNTTTSQPVISPSQNSISTITPSNTPAVTAQAHNSTISTAANDPVQWRRVYMHYGLLKGQYMIWGETGGYLSLYLAENAYEGAYSIHLDSSHGLLSGQLLTYRGTDGQHYTTTIQSISGNTINLNNALEKTVWYGENAWNFYDNASHANYRGYLAIADFATRSLGSRNLNYGKHVLLGDSWFATGTIYDRLRETLPNATFINLGHGGNTSFDLISRFDNDVNWHSPDFVWILTGTNDYWNFISAAQYKQNIQQLILKVEALGAKPIIVDPSVGPLNYNSTELTDLSHSYTNAVEQLQNGY